MGNCQNFNTSDNKYNIESQHTNIIVSEIKEYDSKQIIKIVKIQSLIRQFLSRRRINSLKDQQLHHMPLFSEAVPQNSFPEITNTIVVQVLASYPKYKWPKNPSFKNLIYLPPYKFIKTGAVYKGQWLEGKRHGRGMQIWPDGSFYQGDWENNMASGNGMLIRQNGDFYKGQWVNDRAQGFGLYQNFNGNKYEGYWFEDKQNGEGREETEDFVFVGNFLNGLKEGKGKLIWKKELQGLSYEGNFCNSNIQGKGIMRYQDGKIYEGEWLNNKKHGFGKIIYPNGRIYKGNFQNGQKNGFGEMLYEDGKLYSGFWFKNQQNGEGFVKNKDGIEIKGIWQNGKMIQQICC